MGSQVIYSSFVEDEGLKMEDEEDILHKIERLQSPNGGWTKKALAELGVSWPPKKGWKKELLKIKNITSPIK